MTRQIEDGGPAFPSEQTERTTEIQYGMTLRDWFAGMAMQGQIFRDPPSVLFREQAENAYAIADAMLAQRK